MSALANVRDKLKRRFSMKDNEGKDNDVDAEYDSADDETTGRVTKDIDEAEANEDKYSSGRPNSFLARLISHGNDKTEKQIAREWEESQKIQGQQSKMNQVPEAGTGRATGDVGQMNRPIGGGQIAQDH